MQATHVRIRTRGEWEARRARTSTATQSAPTEAFLHHTDNPMAGRVLPSTAQDERMRGLQNFHMDTRGWADIGYHFVVFNGTSAATARVYAGRPVTVVPAAQLGHNTGTLAIALYQGGADRVMPHTRYLVEQLLRAHPTVRTLGTHRQVSETDCPGDVVAAEVPRIARVAGVSVFRRGSGL